MNDECRIKISKGVTDALKSRKDGGKHIGRPARFMFAEDVATSPAGRVGENTIIRSEQEIYDYARKGFSLYYVAKELDIGYNVLIFEMKAACPEYPRYKGNKDRFSEYNRILKDKGRS